MRKSFFKKQIGGVPIYFIIFAAEKVKT